ncbi:MAG: PLDc N-terminal domain-containing protein, partial [Clostridia bacterium]|nr:PLDc N-terminal domain-containing protein [Clostridia bacterium]
MKKTIRVHNGKEYVDKEISYIPVRYIIAIMLAVLEIVAVIATMFLCAIYIPYFYIAIFITEVGVVLQIIGSNMNPDHKIPWLLFVIILPIVGFMLYFLFHQRKLPKKIIKRLSRHDESLNFSDVDIKNKLQKEDPLISSQAVVLSNIANTHLYQDTKIKYYKLGEELHQGILADLKNAKKFIFLEYFIIEEGLFWNSILDILIEKASSGVEVKVLYDDIGCMNTLPGNYYKQLKSYNIDALPFSILKGNADGEFNNRSHRKILVIDGVVGFTGGVNIADEYINARKKHGHWKDTAIRMEGLAVNELTKLFLSDYYINVKKDVDVDFSNYYI